MTADFDLPLAEVLLRLGIATALGGALGLNRELNRKPAGLRTLALVGLASAAAATAVALMPGATPDAVSRVGQGILTGVGFLGGGVILQKRGSEQVMGLTTAASIWVVAALGFTCGLGHWRLGVLAAVIALAVLIVGAFVEKRYLDDYQED